MRYWLWKKSSGEIGGEAIIGGGWPDSFDFNDPDTLDETGLAVRGQLIAVEGFDSFVSYDCPCDPSVVWCQCSTARCADSRVENDVLVTKPDFAILLDGVEVDHLSVTDKAPNATVTLQLSGSVPDGVVVNAHNTIPVDLLQTSPTALTFNGGVTNTINLVAPSQGMKAGLGLIPANGEDTQFRHIKVRGWA